MIYLNQAATTYPKPQRVHEAYAAALQQPPAGQFRSAAREGKDVFGECRRKLGRLFGIADSDRIFFSCGATDSANAVIYGLGLKGRNVVVTQTEHNSILRPLWNLREQVGSVTVVPCDALGYVRPCDVEAALTEETAAVFVNHCSNVTGMVQDLEAIGRIVHRRGVLFVVDASQSAGCLPVRADDWGIDALIFTGHKSLFGVPGTGGYFVREGVRLVPYRFGGTERNSRQIVYENEDYEYEPGTQNTPGIAALDAGVSYVLERGVERIVRGEEEKMRFLYEGLSAFRQVKLYGEPGRNKGPVLSFNVEPFSSSDVAYILQGSYGIVVRTGLHCAPLIHRALGTKKDGTVRVSLSDLTKTSDVEALVRAVGEIAESGCKI